MNSKQRRQDKRRWKWTVPLSLKQRNNNDYDQMFDWCVATYGNGAKRNVGWREAHRHVGTLWEFDQEQGAILFALRWK